MDARYREGDTIAAESTPPGRGGVSQVRLSGERAQDIAGALFDRELPASGEHRFGRLTDPADGRLIDEAVVAAFAAGHSYTGESVIELQTHGSPVVVADLLGCLYRLGARPAAPGEFTYRAFLNGRIDLTQAEAVADLIAAGSSESAAQALRQLSGELRSAVESLEEKVERLLIWAELELDFVEEDVEVAGIEAKLTLASEAISEASGLLEGYDTARHLREGLKVVISGPPNVGKSSLFNRLVGEKRAIVHASAGTTRDVLRASAYIDGMAFEFFDTAGIREAPGEVEDEGIRRALEAAQSADLVLQVDAPGLTSGIEPPTGSRALIRVMNKIDLALELAWPDGCIPVSAATGQGLEELQQALYRFAVGDSRGRTALINRERHYEALRVAIQALERGREGLKSGLPGEALAEEWREALGALGDITGRRRVEGLLDTIFGSFCIGK
ncbi:MAG: tRNA uridine-5-carboxymethylaminomethyl(34) synthesis GTPase MnmE [Calditrichaeota bacterium]|nr:tRNA uridine-5-carboxymethylaminomethyl(34) synthesis GTPase MnmE [Calditrichota bacterium]